MITWKTAPQEFNLRAGEVHIWKVDLDQFFEMQVSHTSCLSTDEIQRANRFYFEKDQQRFIAARTSLRFLLGKYLGVSPPEIIFQYEDKGKPYQKNNFKLHFNLSHSDQMALLGFVLHTPIGVDIELIKSDIEFETVAEHFFSAYEVKTLLSLPKSQRPEAFFNAWTRKESFIKATGDGLSFPLAEFDVSLMPDEPAKLLATHFDIEEAKYWSLDTFDPAPGFKGAFAWREKVKEVSFWELI